MSDWPDPPLRPPVVATPIEVAERIARVLEDEALVANTMPNGQHPDVALMTHAAALRYAAAIARAVGEAW